MDSTVSELASPARRDAAPPVGSSPELQSLWHIKAGQWEAAHNLAQDIHTPLGSWIHALLHLIEGDIGNANYWYQRAGQPRRKPAEIDAEWERIAAHCLNPAAL